MTDQWLIDGCNLLRSFPGQNWYERLASFASSKQCPCLLVLDGVGDDGEFEKYHTQFFQVIYAQGSSADCVIERTLFQNKGKASFIVVTNDRTVTELATGLGSRVMKNDLFVAFLRESEDNIKTILWDEKTKSHGFNRPLDQQLKEKGFFD